MFVTLILYFKRIFEETKDPTLDPGGRGKIASRELENSGIVCLKLKFTAEEKHSALLDGAHHGVLLELVDFVVALRTAVGPREANGVLLADIFKPRFYKLSEGLIIFICLRN